MAMYMDSQHLYFIAVVLLLVIIIKTQVISKALDAFFFSSFYQGIFARFVKHLTQNQKASDAYMKLKQNMCSGVAKKAEELGGDVLEIGAGTGASLQHLHLPKGSSLVVVDNNPHFEKHFRETLSKYPDINLKEYLVQSAVDMGNIPDNSFAVVFVIDVLCSIEEAPLRKMLQEIKRVLKPEGCFYFVEHVADQRGTWRRTFQNLICSQFKIWPRMFCNCHCNKETWCYIQEAGFRSCTFTYTQMPAVKTNNLFRKLLGSALLYFMKIFMSGHAQK